jgi:hypothetical protein
MQQQIMQSLNLIRQDAAIQSARSDTIELRLDKPTATAPALPSADANQARTGDTPDLAQLGNGNGAGNRVKRGNHGRPVPPQ